MLFDPSRKGDGEALARRRPPKALGTHKEVAHLYKPDERLVGAVNAALAVGVPLLLTGEPGTGKSQLAWYLTKHFGLDDPYVFTVRSTAEADDLLYEFDAVAYFHAAHDPQQTGALNKGSEEFLRKGPLWAAFEQSLKGQVSVVLIDEIDKAPRDFPNDLLHTLDQYEFLCRPTGQTLTITKDHPRPVVLITSNAESRLPEPFLRRCIVHHITLNRPMVEAIVRERAPLLGLNDAMVAGMLDQFFRLRERQDLRKKPGTAELLVWMALCASDPSWSASSPLGRLPHLGALLKDHEDIASLG